MRILFIGNSYTYYHDMPKLFDLLAKENGKQILDVESAAYQYGMMSGFSSELQLYLLESSI